MAHEAFDAIATPLNTGINLLEASAGTGKTYTIAMLVLRFVVERELDIKQLLVVTFTKAATEELKERIRARLTEARQALLNPTAAADSTIAAWLAGLGLAPDIVRQRLDAALLDIDQAAIFTIHGFCQRALAEHALASGQLFDCELSGDIAELQQQCADDFWRRRVAARPAWQIAVLTRAFPTPDSLLASVVRVGGQQAFQPADTDLDRQLAELDNAIAAASSGLATLAATLQTAFPEGLFSASFVRDFPARFEAWKTWLADRAAELPSLDGLTREALLSGLNGVKFKTSKAKPQTPAEQKQAYLDGLGVDTTAFDGLAAAAGQLQTGVRAALLADLRATLDGLLQQRNLMSFDDLIVRLAGALTGANGELLIAELRRRFAAALIDEFQDTDLHQWQIFSTLFGAPDLYLYLIGDPKQAIYKFRGADIFSYFAAQRQAAQHYTLSHNWRSHPDLVGAVNRLFQRPRPFLFEQLDFHPVQAGRGSADGKLADGAPLVLWQLDKHSDKQAHWTARQGSSSEVAERLRAATVAEIGRLLADGTIVENNQTRPLAAGDIAVLVRSNRAAADYQTALQSAGIAAVLNSKQSVFASEQALELHAVLQAVAQAGQLEALKSALTVSWFGLTGQALYRLLQDEAALDGWMNRFQDYLQCWQRHGLLAMLQQLLRRESVETRLSGQIQAERALTNIHHLAERLQQAALDEHLALHKTLDWLRRAILQAEHDSGDDRQLRLESDADAVKIVTTHSAKGLEYPVVFCPDLWRRSDRLKNERWLVQCHEDGAMMADLGSAEFERRRELALREELAEDLRLFYVAVTRAKYRCYLFWADVRGKERPNESAMAYLFEFADLDFAGQRQVLAGLAQAEPASFEHRLLASDAGATLIPAAKPQRPSAVAALEYRRQTRDLRSLWQMSSYTALAESGHDTAPELPADKAAEPADAYVEAGGLPKGAATGNVVHSLLETLSFQALAAGADLGRPRDMACLRHGLHLTQPELLDQLLAATVSTPLAANGEFRLADLPAERCIKEMPFYLSLAYPIDTARINRLLAGCPTYQALAPKRLNGYLTGFIDLVCEYGGQYFLMDYKTNTLADYGHDSLTLAMREHNYGLQYWLYSVVLDRYLRLRLPDYDYQRHFGGIKYLFVRGMRPDQPDHAVYADRPDRETLNGFAAIFFPAG